MLATPATRLSGPWVPTKSRKPCGNVSGTPRTKCWNSKKSTSFLREGKAVVANSHQMIWLRMSSSSSRQYRGTLIATTMTLRLTVSSSGEWMSKWGRSGSSNLRVTAMGTEVLARRLKETTFQPSKRKEVQTTLAIQFHLPRLLKTTPKL